MNLNLNKIRHPLVANSFYLYSAHFADYLLLLFVLPFITRALGPVVFGHIGLAQTFALLVMLVLEFGFSITATRQVANNRNNKLNIQLLAGQVFSFKIILLPIIIFLTIIITLIHPIFFYNPELLIISVSGAIFHGFIPTWYYQGMENFKTLAIVKIIFRLISFFLILIIVKAPTDGWLFLLFHASSSFFIAIILVFFMKKRIGTINLQKWIGVKTILKSSWSGFIIIILPTIFNNIGIFLLSFITNPILLGYYYGVSKIHRAFNTLYSPIFESFFPNLIVTYRKNQKRALQKTVLFNIIIFVLGCCFCLTIWYLSETIITILLGKSFIPAANYLKAFGLLLPLTIISYIWGNQWMIVLKKEDQLANIFLISNIFGIFCLILTISKLEIFAIPLSISLSELIKIILIIKSIK